MASLSDVVSPSPSARLTPKRLQSFRRPGSKGDDSRQLLVEDALRGSLERLQVLIPGFESMEKQGEVDNGEATQQPRKCETSKILVLSAGRQGTYSHSLSAEEREAEDIDGEDEGDPEKIPIYNPQMRPSSFGISSDGKDAPDVERTSDKIMRWWAPASFLSNILTHCTGLLSLRLPKQTPGKTIAVGQDVLSTYHESFLYGKVSLSTRVRAGLRGLFLSSLLLTLECIAALLLLALYVRTTYTTQSAKWITIVQFCCSVFFLMDYLIKLYSAPVRLYYALSINGIIDFISTLPIYFILSGVMIDAAIPEVFLVFRVLRAMPMVASWALPGGAVAQEIFMLVVYVLGVFVLAAGILQWVEWRATPQSVREANGCPSYGCLSFYEAFYFIIVTVSTVGYGDITLKSDWGRLICILVIVAAIVFIPVEVNKIFDLASRRPYGGKYAVRKVVGSRFIIMSGNLSYRAVEDFLSEFFHPSHAKDMRAFPLRVVIMAPFKPSFEMKVLLTEYKGRVEFIEGTPLRDFDLERVSANMASAFFLMADHLAQDLDAEDSTQIMRALSVHRFCGSKVRLIVEMLKPENQDNPIWDDADGGIEIVCPEAICYQLLARSCQLKGLSTFIINLFKAGLKVCNPVHGSWMHQYSHGQQQEIYPVILPTCFYERNVTFEEAAEIVYLKFGIILFGLDMLTDDENGREVVLFPRTHTLKHTDIGLVIAEDLAIAEKITRYDEASMPAWCEKLCKTFNKQFDTDDSVMLGIMQKRTGDGSIGNGSDLADSGLKREKHRRQGSGSISFGMMSSGHRVELQSQLREIVCTSSIHELRGSNGINETTQDERHNRQESNIKTEKVYSLEEAVDLIMQWPPFTPEKPDYPVLMRQAGAIQKKLKDRTLMLVNLDKPHVLVCIQGRWPPNLFCFVAHLRTPSLPKPPIVILHPHEPTTAEWGCVGMFEEVYFVEGTPIYEIDLLRAGILQSEKVVLLSQRGTLEGGNDSTNDDTIGLTPSSVLLDVDNVMITATIERLLHPIRDRIIVELHREMEIHYLRPKLRINATHFDPVLYNRNRSATFLFAPSFIEGKGFCSATLTFLLYGLFFNRNTVAITEKLISGGESVQVEGGEEVEGARLEQVGVPKAWQGGSYGEMVVGMLREKQWLALGLYRPVGCHHSIVSYVYTNPPPSEVLVPGDLVYVLLR